MDIQETQQSSPKQSGSSIKYVIGIIIIGIIIVAVSLISKNQTPPAQKADTNAVTEQAGSVNQQITQTPPTIVPTLFTMADIQKHNNKDSCYATINGSVFDLTAWIYKHPGGPAKILALCGKDGTNAFNDKHGGQPRPETELTSFKIGELIK